MNLAKLHLAAAIAAAVCCGQSSAQTVLIDPTTNNGSFEFADGALNTTKIQMWDTSPDIDNWVEWVGESTDANDSGVENTGNASDGTMVAFLRGGNATYNLTTYAVAEGDQFAYSWDHVLRADRNHSVWLIYDDGGTITKILDTQIDTDAANGEGFTYSGVYTVPSGSPAIGNAIGIGIHTFGAYPEVDNFRLTRIPEPSSIALLGLTLLGLVPRGRRS